MFFYAMHEMFASTLLGMYPEAPLYGSFYIIGEMPAGFDGEVMPLYLAGFDLSGEAGATPEQLKTLVDSKLTEEYFGRVIKITRSQGEWLHDNHPLFKPAEEST